MQADNGNGMRFIIRFNSIILKRDIPPQDRIDGLLQLKKEIPQNVPSDMALWTFTVTLNNEICSCYVAMHQKYKLTPLIEENKSMLNSLEQGHRAKRTEQPAIDEVVYVMNLEYKQMVELSQSKNHQRDVAYCYHRMATLWQWSKKDEEMVRCICKCNIALSKIPRQKYLSQKQLVKLYPDWQKAIEEEFSASRGLKYDLVEQSEDYIAIYDKVEQLIQQHIDDQGRIARDPMQYWAIKKQVLQEFGISWRSPKSLNPRVMF